MRNPRPGSRLGVCKCRFRWPGSDGRTAAGKLPDAPGRSVSGAAAIGWFSRLLRFTADSPPAVIRTAQTSRPLNTKAVTAVTARSTCVWQRAQVALVYLRWSRSSFHL